jgi:hypothetical protein
MPTLRHSKRTLIVNNRIKGVGSSIWPLLLPTDGTSYNEINVEHEMGEKKSETESRSEREEERKKRGPEEG